MIYICRKCSQTDCIFLGSNHCKGEMDKRQHFIVTPSHQACMKMKNLITNFALSEIGKYERIVSTYIGLYGSEDIFISTDAYYLTSSGAIDGSGFMYSLRYSEQLSPSQLLKVENRLTEIYRDFL